MKRITEWLGSGFAFAVGLILGSLLMKMAWKQPKSVMDESARRHMRWEARMQENLVETRRQTEALEQIAAALEK